MSNLPSRIEGEEVGSRDTLAEMATQCTAPPELWNAHANEVLRLREVEAAAIRLQEVIRMAGLTNLSQGVQLGPVSWLAKATAAMEWLDAALLKALPKNEGEQG